MKGKKTKNVPKESSSMNTNTVILLSETVNTKTHAIWEDFCNK